MSNILLPTVKNRIHSMDFLRGVAILGILAANIFAFAWYGLSQELFGYKAMLAESDAFEAIRNTFVSGKFRAMLAMLFGVGLYLQFRKCQSSGSNWYRTYAKRTVMLMLLGMFHGIFIWYGDILFMYSTVAIIAMLFASVSDKAVFWTAVGMIGLSFLISLSTMGESTNAVGYESYFGWATHAAELQTFQVGTYFQQVQFRFFYFFIVLFALIGIYPSIASQFLIGILLARKGVLAKPSAHPQLVRQLSYVGIFGLLLNAFLAYVNTLEQAPHTLEIIELFGNTFLAIGYLTWGAILVEKGRAQGFINLVSPVGRMALSSYLLQSILCTTIFYSWGGGLFAKLSYWQALMVVPAVWVVNIVFAHAWLKKFDMGPVEWLWRSAMLGRNATKAIQESSVQGNVPPVLLKPPPNPQFRDWN